MIGIGTVPYVPPVIAIVTALGFYGLGYWLIAEGWQIRGVAAAGLGACLLIYGLNSF